MSGQKILLDIFGALEYLIRLIYFYMEALYRQIIPPPLKLIDGEIILITGAAGGIGSSLCRSLVRSGSNMKLVLWDLNLANLEKLAEELKESNSSISVFSFEVDISAKENIQRASVEMRNLNLSPTILFNNAGIAPLGNFLQLTNDQVEKTLQINLMSNLWIIRQFLGSMVKNNHGRIINICSVGGLKAANHSLPYYTSKFGVNGMTESLKIELDQFGYTGIHCTTVYPFFVRTPLVSHLSFSEDSIDKLPYLFRQFMDPEDVANKIVDGVRREYEYIYMPWVTPIYLMLDYLLPRKVRKALQQPFLHIMKLKDPAEHKRVHMSYLETVRNKELDD